ncbi:MAG: hypothetical protein KJP02_05390 [Octadecabacter sp.]|nr:hypothetical protein [Octadecabacter sp.]
MKHRPDMHQIEQSDEDWEIIAAALREVLAVAALAVLCLSFGGALLLWWLI